jgi:protein involved in polysaccharide export with SLBB domain
MVVIQFTTILNKKRNYFSRNSYPGTTILILLFLLFSLPFLSKAQGILSGQNLSTVNVDNLSDDQIRQLLAQAQSAGLSQSQLEQQALARGLPPEQLQKLEARINKVAKNEDINNTSPQPSNLNSTNGRKVIGSSAGDSLNNLLKQNDLVFEKIKVKVFGEDLFNNPSLTFEPNLRIPTPPNYILGQDDQINIDIFGNSEVSYKLSISPDGYIRIPNIGPVLLSGLTVSEAKEKIFKELSRLYVSMKGSNPKTFVHISLGDIRSIKVTLVGEVKLPGTYTLPSLATVFNALYSSGGPSKSGSFRNIELIRDNKVLEKIDIYDFLLHGIQKGNILLKDQDVIKISPYQDRIEIQGEVKRPGIYEIKPGESLLKVLDYAAGFTDKAYTHRIKIIQSDSREKKVIDVDDLHFGTYMAHRGDLYTVEPIINRFANRVQIRGSVFRPGIYALEDGLTLAQLIRKSDGIKEDAFTYRAIIRRINEEGTSQIISFDVNRILNGTDQDIPLFREDSVHIYSRFNLREKYIVTIEGEVIKPDTMNWALGMHLQDLILHAGGLTDAASFKRIEVTRRVKDSDPLSQNSPIAKTFRFDINPDFKSNKEANDFLLEPFDNVVVRSLPGYNAQQYVTIIGEVLYGGRYGITYKTEKISDLIKLAGGLSVEAFPQGATLIRNSSDSKLEKDKRRQLMLRLRTAGKDSLYITRALLREDSIAHIEARPVGIDLVKILQNPGSKYDLTLNDGDSIKIPKKLETVEVKGDVLYPVRVRYNYGYTTLHYINAAGGFAANAAKRRTYVVYANGSVRGSHNYFFFNTYPKILPGAQIVIPDRGPITKTSLAELIGISTSVTSLALLIYTIFK